MLLSLSVPAGNERGPLYMEQALAAIHQGNPRHLPLSLEMGCRDGAVILSCRVPEELARIVEGQFYAQYPDCRVERLPEGSLDPPPGDAVHTAMLRLAPDLFPLKRYPQFEDALNRTTADPLTAILLTLARAQKSPVQSHIQIALLPAPRRRRLRAQAILRRLTTPFFRRHPRLAHIYAEAACSPHFPVRCLAGLLGRLGRRDEGGHGEAALHTSSARLHDREEDHQAGSDKLGRLLFAAAITLRVSAPPDRAEEAQAKLREMAGAFGQFSSPRLASFHLTPIRRGMQLPRWRRPRGFLLSTEEAATLFHPPTATVKAPTLASVGSREFAPPVLLPTPQTDRELAILGTTRFRERRERFGIRREDRLRHLSIIGKTGMGKSTLLSRLIATDIAAGRGVGLLDPHGDLADAVLASVPAHRTNDVVLFDAGDSSHPLAFNILACRDDRERPLRVSGILSAFRKLYGEFWGPRMEHIFRNALLALLEQPGSSLLSLVRLLSDGRYRQAVIGTVSDPAVRAFWEREFAGMPAKLQAEALSPIQNKIGHFVSSPLLRNILGQSKSTVDLRAIMDDGKILLVNLSKGRVGDDASALLGSFLVTAIQLAAMSRADTAERERRDFFLYVDEFQTYATDSFATILSEARKYRLGLTLANQYLAQMEEATLAAVFGNVGTLVAFQAGAKDADLLAEQFGGDLTAQDLLSLPRYEAYVRLLLDGLPSRPFTMRTLPPQMGRLDPQRSAIIRRTSRQRYARPLAQVEAEIRSAFAAA